MRTIHLLRHADSDWEKGRPDEERPLNEQGILSCSVMGGYLQAGQIAPDLILCSSALRAQQTLEGIRFAMPDAPTLVAHELYLASVTDLLQRLRSLSANLTSVMVIGHNPGLQDLAGGLSTEGELRDELASAFPPASLATLTVDVPWTDIRRGSAQLTSFIRPADLRDNEPLV